MATQLFANNATSTLSGSLAQGGTSMTLATGQGSRFPSPTGGDYFLLTLFEKDGSSVENRHEVVKVTAKSGDALTIVRDHESMTGQSGGYAYPSVGGATVYCELRWTAAGADNMLQTGDIGTTVQAYDANLPTWPSTVSATEVGYLDGVTSAIQTQISSKQDTLVSGTSIKTVNSTSLLGSGNITTGDASTNTATSVDSEIALFSSTGGKTLKRATTTGILKAASGVLSAATSGTDYAPATSGTSILKGNGTGGFSAATANTDYLTPPSGTAVLKAGSGGALANAVAGTDYLAPPSGTSILKANSGGALANAVAGTDYLAPAAIGVTVQAYDADLTTWAGVTPGTGVTTMLATPTKANFDAALSDDNFAYVGAANTYTATQTFKGVTDTVYTLTDSNFDINPANGAIQTVTITAGRSPTASSFAAGQAVLLGVTGNFTITWPSITWVKAGGGASAPSAASSGALWVLLWKVSSTLYGAEVGKP